MVAAEQNLRHLHATQFTGTSVLRIFQQPVGEGFLLRTLTGAQHAGNEPGDAIGKHHGGQFTAGQDVVPDADFLINAGIQCSLIHTFVMAAQQHKVLLLGKLPSFGCGQRCPARPHVNTLPMEIIARDLCHGIHNGLRQHHHASTAAKGIIVRVLVFPVGKRTNVHTVDFDQSLFPCSAENAGVQHAVEHFRENGEDVNLHERPPRQDADC